MQPAQLIPGVGPGWQVLERELAEEERVCAMVTKAEAPPKLEDAAKNKKLTW